MSRKFVIEDEDLRMTMISTSQIKGIRTHVL